MLELLDIFFIVFHTALTLFNLFGWIWRRTRKFNLIILLLTGFSWFGLGIFYGIGYCPLTDWHYRVLRKLGETGLPNSYLKYLFDRITGLDINSNFVEIMTLILFLFALLASIYFNFFRNKLRANFEN
ncbi:MAG: DUF2784 domain-containing protein [Bacteroidales bacterium]|nr:DUF2784 domain-containing protein [Bacteroidales bacterium]